MLFQSILFILTMSVVVSAAPWNWPYGFCLDEGLATFIVNQYATLLVAPGGPNFNATAEALLDPAFKVQSDSIQTLSGQPLGALSYPSKQAFIEGQAHTPPIPVLITYSIFHSCNRIAWRWVGEKVGPAANEPVQGIITFNITDQSQIIGVNSEFNSGAWLVDLGKPECH